MMDEVERLINDARLGDVGGGERLHAAIANAIEGAEKRGRVAGLREAEGIVSELREDDTNPHDLRDARDAIASRVAEVERE